MILPFLLLNAAALVVWGAEYSRDLEISEGAVVGTRIGFIEDGASGERGPPYLIIPVQDTVVDTDLDIDQQTGEIRTRVPLDRETRASYYFVAVPISGQNIQVTVRIVDENDNAPTFPSPVMNIEFSENTPRDVKRSLNPAKDQDVGNYNTQTYNIVSGNVNNAFRLSYHREKDGVLYPDLQINGALDRETLPSYTLVVEALDGGTPPLKGSMTVNILIQDVNDNPPVFNQTRYFGVVAENATLGTSILKVHATDADSGDNGVVEYAINRRQSDKDGFFDIDPGSGLITVNKPLDFEAKEVHELVVVAKDRGMQPLESTAFISIKVQDVNDNQPSINLIFLSDDATPKISEGAETGEFVARLSVNDPDSKNEYSNVNVTLEGGDGHFGLTTQDNIIYLVIVSMPIDRELKSNYTLNVVATDTGTPPLHASKSFNLEVTDVNDNAPEFEKTQFHTNVLEKAEPGTSVFQVRATDQDEGVNSEVTYSLVESAADGQHSWFDVDESSGVITTRTYVDCDTDSMPKLIVLATDKGTPPLSSSTTVFVTIHDVNDNEPIFSQTYYDVTIPEDSPKGSCVLKVSAVDSDCGVNAMVNYTLLDAPSKNNPFYVRSISGEICINSDLDYEAKHVYEFLVIATDRGGLSATSAVKITLTDVNDNKPTFSSLDNYVNFRDEAGAPFAMVRASDADSGQLGAVTYRLSAGNEDNLFRVDRNSGELFATRPKSLLPNRKYVLNVSATDGMGARSVQDAQVSIFVAAANGVRFERSRYTFNVSEDVPLNTPLGNVKINTPFNGEEQVVRYFIKSGDIGGWFNLDPFTGNLKTSAFLDYEKHSTLVLNVQAQYGSPTSYTYTQIIVNVEDRNDNAPEFDANPIRLSVPESAGVGIPLLVAFARDRDSGAAGRVRYSLSAAATTASSGTTGTTTETGFFIIHANTGILLLASTLDYETSQRHTLVVTATDGGEPRLQTNMTVFVEVQDVNNHEPIFEQTNYSIVVSESLPVHSQILQVNAIDKDVGNNAKISYKLTNVQRESGDEEGDTFGVSPNNGWIYLKRQLDRETTAGYTLTIVASDNGTPRSSATAIVLVTVSDYNDNDPQFFREAYEFAVEENRPHGTVFGTLQAFDADADNNAAIRYSLIPSNSSFQINAFTGVLSTREPLDRELKSMYELVAEAKDQGTPSRSSRVALRIRVTDVNDNTPVLDDPQEDVISVREEQPPGTDVVHVRAVDPDEGYNATLTYSILKGRDTDGYGVFTIDSLTGIVRTRSVLDHEERSVYRIAVAAADNGIPPKQAVRVLRVEILDVNDNRPTFSSSSLIFKIREDVPIGFVVGNVMVGENSGQQANRGHIMYKLSFISPTDAATDKPFDIDRRSGSLVVVRGLDREACAEYRLEVRILDTSSNPQSSAVVVKIEVLDVNDNAPRWKEDPLQILVPEDSLVGATVWNFSVTDEDAGPNKEVRYGLVSQWPALADGATAFAVDSLTGNLMVASPLDYEKIKEYTLVVRATDQATNVSDRLSTSLTVQVVLQDTNDNAPVFLAPVHKNVFIGNALHATKEATCCVERVFAVDQDSGANGRVTYAIASGNEAGYFALDRETGELSLSRPVSFAASFLLNITAADDGNPVRMYSNTWLNVTTQPVHENRLRFTKNTFSVNVTENFSVGGIVFAISPGIVDYTSDNLNKLRYEVSSAAAATATNNVNDADVFAFNEKDNTIVLRRALDRERRSRYLLPLYARDANNGKFDSTIVVVNVLDVNDNAPRFAPGSCFPLYVPENMETSVVHTMVATDLDAGNNGKIMYSISDGNVGNKFQIDSMTGELTAKSLDREAQSRYYLTVLAQDLGGSVSLSGHCNLTVIVEDENDNEPQFDKPMYIATVAENVAVGATVLVVRATDADLDTNGQVIYSFKNETSAAFHINNHTGVITTTRELDHEKQSLYTFQVMAADNGRYRSQFQIVSVQIIVEDVNDNRPEFGHYAASVQVSSYAHIGAEVARISASDRDRGENGDVVYRVLNDQGKFRINPSSGAIAVASSLSSDGGKSFLLEVIATDKGSPPLSSNCSVEIKVDNGDGSKSSSAVLRFQNASYMTSVSESASLGEGVITVYALRYDGRKARITYSFASGNRNGPFEINPQSGLIRVHNPALLDYETCPEFHFVVAAQTENVASFAFANLTVRVTNQNDNAPVFTQERYFTSVLEGISKGTYVIELLAVDADSSPDSRISYHIVDGNHDNAFIIEPPTSNVIKTNIVLDAEIRNTYKLTVIATDDGIPQMTGTTAIRINVIDVNDNQPSFPPHTTINVSEGVAVGSVITSVVANDVDTFPSLVYTLDSRQEHVDASSTFAVDRYNGRVILRRALDYETKSEYSLRITASDRKHTVNTTLYIKVTDDNDNAPIFDNQFYHFALSNDKNDVITGFEIRAHDSDSGDNSAVSYSLVSPVAGISVDKYSGIISINKSVLSKDAFYKGYFDVFVKASDGGTPELSSSVPVRFDMRYGSHWNSPTPLPAEYRISVRENASKGKQILRLYSNYVPDSRLTFAILRGNEDKHFDIIGPYGDLVLLKQLDRETTDVYSLLVSVGQNVTFTRVHVIVEDVNDNAPQFTPYERVVVLSESAPLGTAVAHFHATDNDLPPNADVRYEILSGNDRNLFAVDAVSGLVTVRGPLDYDHGAVTHTLIVKATDVARPPTDLPLCSLASVRVDLTDENDNEPKFPISEYLEFVAENEPIGVAVFTARATDADKGVYGRLNYSIVSAAASGYADVDDSWKLFRVHATTGLVSTNAHFDYEVQSRYAFNMVACDVGGRCAKVKVRVEIESKDEFHPQFTERTFRFVLPIEGVPVGYTIGYVTATDRDKGPDGRIVYQLTTQNPYFKVNRTTGAIMVKKKVDRMSAEQDISLVVSASSGRQGSLTNMSVVEIAFDELSPPPSFNLPSSGTSISPSSPSSPFSTWLMVFFVLFVVLAAGVGGFFGFLHFRNRRQKNMNKSHLGGGQNACVDTYVDPGVFDTMPIRAAVGHAVTQFAPPKYDEIPTYRTNNSGSNSAAATTSELSGSDQSGSSGRGSAEDGEDVDEEIRMINEGQPRQRHNADDDNLSDVSVHNTQEYLARLGIIDSHSASQSHSSLQKDGNGSAVDMLNHRRPMSNAQSLNIFDDDGANEADITNIIYAKLNDVASERGGSSQEEVDRTSSTGRVTSSVDRSLVLDGYRVPTGTQPSMSGSLSSIVHSEEELTGSYNWDYLLDWGPQYQPLAHVFSEIARLKDDAASVKSANSGTSSGGKSKNLHQLQQQQQAVMKTVPPPLLTNVAPRTIAAAAPVLNSTSRHPTITGHSTPHHSHQMLLLPRSPIGHDTSGGFSTSAAMSPSFSPSLSPLATKSPSVSPLHLHTIGNNNYHHHPHHLKAARHLANESDIRI